MKYDNDALRELCSRFDLFEYISDQYTVTKTGDKYFIHCPLHEDKTPSLCIDREKNYFYCFSCSIHGSAIDWFRKVEKLSFNSAVDRLVQYTGCNIKHLKSNEGFRELKKINRAMKQKKTIILNRSYIDLKEYEHQFSEEIPDEWIKEGISANAMHQYNVRVDQQGNRIVYPVYDNDGHIIGVKGRTRYENYKDLGIPKYMNYYKIGTVDFFQGMQQARDFICEKNQVIIFEGIKSCMKAMDYGFRNTIAAETSHLSDGQIKILIGLHVREIVIAFDKGVSVDKMKKNVKMLRHFSNVSIVIDQQNLLEDKESPVDRGKETWDILYERRKQV